MIVLIMTQWSNKSDSSIFIFSQSYARLFFKEAPTSENKLSQMSWFFYLLIGACIRIRSPQNSIFAASGKKFRNVVRARLRSTTHGIWKMSRQLSHKVLFNSLHSEKKYWDILLTRLFRFSEFITTDFRQNKFSNFLMENNMVKF